MSLVIWSAQRSGGRPLGRRHDDGGLEARMSMAWVPRRQWTTYNRIRTGVGRFGEAMKRWGLKSTSECECGAPNQSVQHIMDDCTMHRPPNGERGLTDLDEDTRIWLASTSLEI